MKKSKWIYFRRIFSAGSITLALAITLNYPAFAQDRWPEKPITIIVPFAPGGGTDIIGRLIAVSLTKSLGRSVLIENRPGAGGNIGMGMASRAPADGYTLLMTSSAFFINPALYKTDDSNMH